jgi:hypothetical protein
MYAEGRRGINMSGLSRAPLSSAAPAPRHAPAHAGTSASRNVARDFAARAGIFGSSLAGRTNEKLFVSDYPRSLANCLRLWGLSAADPLPVAHALAVAFLFARRGRPVLLLRLPPRPLPRCLPAARGAIALVCLPGMEPLLASFQQTASHPWPACQTLAPTFLIFALTCRTLGRAHGR